MGVRTFGPNSVPIHSQGDAVLALVGMKCVPFPVTESSKGAGLICRCYPASTVVDMKRDLDDENTRVRISVVKIAVFLH